MKLSLLIVLFQGAWLFDISLRLQLFYFWMVSHMHSHDMPQITTCLKARYDPHRCGHSPLCLNRADVRRKFTRVNVSGAVDGISFAASQYVYPMPAICIHITCIFLHPPCTLSCVRVGIIPAREWRDTSDLCACALKMLLCTLMCVRAYINDTVFLCLMRPTFTRLNVSGPVDGISIAASQDAYSPHAHVRFALFLFYFFLSLFLCFLSIRRPILSYFARYSVVYILQIR